MTGVQTCALPIPRSKSSIRGRNYVAQGDSVDVKGTRAIRKEKKPVKATWY